MDSEQKQAAASLSGEEWNADYITLPELEQQMSKRKPADHVIALELAKQKLAKIDLDEDDGVAGVDDKQEAIVEHALAKACGKTGSKYKKQACDCVEKIAKDKKAGTHAGKEVGIKGPCHATAMKAIEDESIATSPDDEKKGQVVTGELLRVLSGSKTNPEEKKKGANVVQGDMLGTSKKGALALMEAIAKGERWAGALWAKHSQIEYCFDPKLAASSKKAFLDGVQHFKDKVPCLGFKEVAVDPKTVQQCATYPAIYVQSANEGCWAHVGQWDTSVCNLQANACDSLGIAAHEIGHNLGMTHEQGRSDHAKYVSILWDNIEKKNQVQYETESKADVSTAYDVMSLMHYGDSDFGKTVNGQKLKTMKIVGSSQKTMGNRQGLTYADVVQVSKMYKCAAPAKFKLCTEKENGCTKEDCSCGGSEVFKSSSTLPDGSTCNQCIVPCFDSSTGYGKPGFCGCPPGKKKTSFTSGGKTYHQCAPAPAKSKCVDIWDDCSYFGDDCSSSWFATYLPNCKKTCGKCT